MAGLKIGIDLGTHYTKLLVQKKRGNKMLILDYKKAKTPRDSIVEGEIKEVDKLATMLREILGSYKTKGNVFLSATMPALINRRLILPLIKENKLNSMVRMQLEHLFSESFNNYIIQYRISDIIREEGIRKAVINVFALPRKTLTGYVELFEMAGISPYVFDVHPNCVSKLIENNIISNLRADTQNIALIDFGYSMTGIHIFEKGSLILTRVLPIGSRMIEELVMAKFQVTKDDAEKIMIDHTELDTEKSESGTVNPTEIIKAVVERISNEIQRVFRFFTLNRQSKTVERVLIYGGYAGLKNLDKYLSSLLNCPVELPGKLENIVFRDNVNSQTISDCLNLFGILIRKDAKQFRKELMRNV